MAHPKTIIQTQRTTQPKLNPFRIVAVILSQFLLTWLLFELPQQVPDDTFLHTANDDAANDNTTSDDTAIDDTTNDSGSISDTTGQLLNYGWVSFSSIQLMAMGAGFFAVYWLFRVTALIVGWIAALLMCAWICFDWFAILDHWPVVAILSGLAVSILWRSGQQAIMETTPNRDRWRVTGIVGFSVPAALFMTALANLDGNSHPEWLTTLTGSAAIVLAPLVGFLFTGVAGFTAAPETPLAPSASSSCCDTICDDQKSNHDHDHPAHEVTEGTGGCGEENCCSVVTSTPTPMWAGWCFATAGWLLLPGVVIGTLVEISNSGAGRVITPVAIMVAVAIYRRLVRFTGHTLALPTALLILFTAATGLLMVPFGTVWLSLLVIIASIAFAASHGSQSLVTEYFQDTHRCRNRTLITAGGAFSAGVVLAIPGFVNPVSTGPASSAPVWISGLSIGCSVVLICGMRKIRSPILVTRFAERYVKT
ncbi:MAG: hypothetical protein KDA91_19765 [Planctomycetaceae bacterium]|nr:hypothetical protein [Planctomycetaceae bacterium]